MEKIKFKGVIFDLDGTLLDTITDIADSVNKTLKEFGFDEHPVYAYHYFIGTGWYETIHAVLPKNTPKEITELVLEKSRARYHKNWNKTTVSYKGIPELLNYLAQKKILTAVLTNKAHDLAIISIKETLPDWSFDFIMGRGNAFKPKPDPEGALIIARRSGIDPSQFLFVGDSDVDMITANAAGMFGVGACWGYRDEEELRKSGSKALAYAPEEIIGLLLPC